MVRTRGASLLPGTGHVTAYTLPALLDATNKFPPRPNVMARAFGTRAATSMWKPGGSLICSSGNADCANEKSTKATSATARQRCNAGMHDLRVRSHASRMIRDAVARGGLALPSVYAP